MKLLVNSSQRKLLSRPSVYIDVPMNTVIAIPLTIVIVVVNIFCGQLITAASTVQSNDAVLQTNYETERYAVLSAIIRDMYVNDRTRLLVIEHKDRCPTSQPSDAPDSTADEHGKRIERQAFQQMPQLARETIDDFHSRAKQCSQLAKKLDIPVKYVLVGRKDLDGLFRTDDLDFTWRRFYKRYPGSSGVISFSNPGFNHDYTQALVSTGWSCGGLCGEGHFVFLIKESGVWKTKNKAMTWVS